MIQIRFSIEYNAENTRYVVEISPPSARDGKNQETKDRYIAG